MRHGLRERVAPILAFGGTAAALPPLLLHYFGRDAATFDSTWHFFGVGMSALAAAFAALLLTVAGARRQDGRTVLVGTAFAAMAALLGLHGLATPGFLVEQNGVVAFTGAATLPVGGAILALSALPSLRRPRRLKPLRGGGDHARPGLRHSARAGPGPRARDRARANCRAGYFGPSGTNSACNPSRRNQLTISS